jgi:F-type H+-transporting ATPase subunit delta
MKISIPQYARGLYDAVSGQSEKEAPATIKNFVAVLGRHRDLGKAEAIISALKELWDKEHGELAVELISARELEPAAKEMIIAYLREQTAAKKINLHEKIDKSLIGGFVLRYDSRVVDGSLKNSLEELRNKISS